MSYSDWFKQKSVWGKAGHALDHKQMGVGPLGPYNTLALLEAAWPSASNAGKTAYVGSAAPYVEYISNGNTGVTGWKQVATLGTDTVGNTVLLSNNGNALSTPTNRNLFDPYKATDGIFIYGSNGTIAYNTLVGISGFIPVTPGVTYTASLLTTTNPIRMYAFYDANGVFTTGGSDNQTYFFTAPAGAAFVRVTYNYNGPYTKFNFQLEVGSAPTTFYQFSSGLSTDSTISEKSLPSIARSVNLFNPNEAVDGYYLSNTNNIQASAAFGLSGYIPVESGFTYSVSDWVGATSGSVSPSTIYRFTTYFDANKNYVAGGASGSGWQFVAPAGVYFVRFSYNIVTTNGMTSGKNSLQFEKGNVYTKYVPYSRSFANDAMQSVRSIPNSSWGVNRLRRFQAWKRVPDYSYDLVMCGDSYIDGNYFGKALKTNLLAKGFVDGGPGLCAFFSGDGPLASQSIDTTQLQCSWTTGDWVTTFNPSWGPSGSEVVSSAASKVITMTAGTALASVTLLYKIIPSGAGFTYAVNGGGATTVSTANATTSIGTVVINTAAAGSTFTITITALGAGVSLAGGIGRKAAANSLTVHKSGLTGSQAVMVGGSLYQAAATPMMPNGGGVMFMWGTNEISANIPPSVMKGNIQNLVNYWRAIDPMCDLIFMGPPQTSRGVETVTTYATWEYNEVMYQLAVENSGAAFIGFEKIFGPFGQSTVDKLFIHGDRVHPGSRGQVLISESLTSLFI